MPSVDRLFQGGIVASLIAVAVKRIGFAVKVVRCLIRMPRRHQRRRLLEMLCGVHITQLRQCYVASAGEKFRSIQSMAILRFLSLLLELARLPKSCKLALLGLFEQGVRL